MVFPLLSQLFSRNKRNVFFGLLLSESSGVAYAFEQTDTDIEVLLEEQFAYSNSFDGLLDDVDIILSKYEKALHQEFKKVIFVVPACGLKEGTQEVLQPYRGSISEVVRNLNLEAMGYIEMTDVFKHELSQFDSALYMEIGRQKTSLILMHDGVRTKHSTVNTHPLNIVAHIDELVTKGTNIYLYSISQPTSIDSFISGLQDYVTHPFKKQDVGVGLLAILREQLIVPTTTPQATQNPSEIGPPSTLHTQNIGQLGGIPSIGQGVHESVESTLSDDESTMVVDTENVSIQEKEEYSPPWGQEVVASENKVIISNEDVVEGFKVFKNQKQSNQADGYIHAPVDIPSPKTHIPREDGVYIEQAVVEPVQSQEPSPDDGQMADESIIIDKASEGADPTNPNKTKPLWRSILFSIIVFTSICLVGVCTFEILLHKVVIKIHIPTETLSLVQSISGLPVIKVVEEKEINLSVDTTGTRQIGERAKGQVIIASFDDKQASFSAGTKLTLEDAVYQIDADVILPAASIDTGSGTKAASKKTVAASATFIGSEGNIEKGKQFEVEEYPKSLYYAISEGTFAGGTRKTVSVVSARDLEKLKNMVTDKAKQASASARAGTSEDVITLDDISTVDIDNLDYSASVGEVASTINATGMVKAQLFTIEKSKVIQEVGVLLRKDKGEGYRMALDSLSYTFSDINLSENEDAVDVLLSAKVPVYKGIEAQKIKGEIRLKPITVVTEFLRKQYGVVQVDYMFMPKLGMYEMYIPYNLPNIAVEIMPQDSVSSP